MAMQQMMNSAMSVSSQKSYNEMQQNPNEGYRNANGNNPANNNYNMGMMGSNSSNTPGNSMPKV